MTPTQSSSKTITPNMEESLILEKFDNLVESGLVLYDDKQQIVEHVDGDLKVQSLPKP